MSATVVVLDYGSGNIRSAVRALEHVGADVTLTADPDAALAADGLFVPGVGNFHACMAGLAAADGPQIIDLRLAGGRPVLGVCVGMQVMFEGSTEPSESPVDGVGEWPGTVSRLVAPVVPHMGWSTVEVPQRSVLFDGIAGERFYFVHSYAAHRWELETSDGPVRGGRAAGHLGHPRRAVRGGRRERPAVGDPVPPREVRRGRPGPAAQLGPLPLTRRGMRHADRPVPSTPACASPQTGSRTRVGC